MIGDFWSNVVPVFNVNFLQLDVDGVSLLNYIATVVVSKESVFYNDDD